MSVFTDTEIAFKNKSTAELRKSQLLFGSLKSPFLAYAGSRFLNFAVEKNLPFAEELVKNTLFAQFVGGVDREESREVVKELFRNHIGSIFDYSKEGIEKEEDFDETLAEIIQNIKFAEGNPAVPFVVFKPSGFGRIEIFDKTAHSPEKLSAEEKAEWERVVHRFDKACAEAQQRDVRIMVDAEETWLQDAADDLTNEMMAKYNREKAIVWNTVQMYRTGRQEYLEEDLQRAKEKNYFLGYKFVRGAYMEKERARAAALGYPDPIQPDKAATDANYNSAVDFVLRNLDRVSAFFGSHNEYSMELIMRKMTEAGLANDDERMHFGQLYGMSDNITYFLGAKNYNAAKYLPYGSVKEVVPYLVRRAMENTSVAGQTGRELSLIRKELKRRGARDYRKRIALGIAGIAALSVLVSDRKKNS